MKDKKKERSLNKENKNKYEYKLIYYIIGYAIGYLISLCVTGVPSLIYLIPIKVDAIGISLCIGSLWNAYHYKIGGDDARSYGFLPAVIAVLIILITLILIKLLIVFKIVATPDPFAGFFAVTKR